MSARYYYSVDEQGSTDFIIDRSGKVKNEYWYDAFGNVLESKQEVHNRITYTGQQFDSITQQYYLRARFYNPVIGRFSQEDIYRGDGLNLYAYCGNNPVVYWDPSGYSGNSGKCKSKTSSIYTNEDGKTFKKDKNGRWHSADGKYAGNVTGDTARVKIKRLQQILYKKIGKITLIKNIQEKYTTDYLKNSKSGLNLEV